MGPGGFAATHSHAVLRGAQNPHVLLCTLRFLCSVRLALVSLATVFEASVGV